MKTVGRTGRSRESAQKYRSFIHMWGEYTRGAGVQDLANAVQENRKPRTEAGLACHVIEIITGLMDAAEKFPYL